MRSVFEGDVEVEQVQYENIATFGFGIFGSTGRSDGKYMLSIGKL
jgi:hypothetical protein